MKHQFGLPFSGAAAPEIRPTCIDIFCGAGGTTYGAMQAGLHVAYGLDNDPSAIATFAANHPEAFADHRDIAAVRAEEVLGLAGIDRIDFLLSGPNCQGVSQMGLFWKDDPRNLMFVHLARLMDEFISLDRAPANVSWNNSRNRSMRAAWSSSGAPMDSPSRRKKKHASANTGIGRGSRFKLASTWSVVNRHDRPESCGSKMTILSQPAVVGTRVKSVDLPQSVCTKGFVGSPKTL